jgi:hypothetical protein
MAILDRYWRIFTNSKLNAFAPISMAIFFLGAVQLSLINL